MLKSSLVLLLFLSFSFGFPLREKFENPEIYDNYLRTLIEPHVNGFLSEFEVFFYLNSRSGYDAIFINIVVRNESVHPEPDVLPNLNTKLLSANMETDDLKLRNLCKQDPREIIVRPFENGNRTIHVRVDCYLLKETAVPTTSNGTFYAVTFVIIALILILIGVFMWCNRLALMKLKERISNALCSRNVFT